MLTLRLRFVGFIVDSSFDGVVGSLSDPSLLSSGLLSSMYVALIDTPLFFRTFLDTTYPSGCFCSCVTYADVLPPTVTHLSVPGFPDGYRHVR